ncbi:unnamed protein product [Paramecium sonneborni]|uniref:Uncharacterized protein n=1 Tax=Paramecium sonneborni TaxID=65129 RepID=A0A8S1LZE3_9CILI|nr:unnamed protein product [Paramecium sonneborni]
MKLDKNDLNLKLFQITNSFIENQNRPQTSYNYSQFYEGVQISSIKNVQIIFKG